MGATSVTGVGPGDVSGHNKGSEHMTLGVTHLIGPHILYAGTVTCAAKTADVNHPLLDGALSDYLIFVFNYTDGSAVVLSSVTLNGFTVTTNGATDVVNWMVVKL